MLTLRRSTGALLLVAAACSNNPPPSSDGGASAVSRSENVITAAELADPSLAGSSLYDAIRKLRPRFLSSRGTVSLNATAGLVHVSVDGGPLAAASTLNNYLLNTIGEIRYLNSTDAAQRYGTAANGGGVILIRSK